MWGGKRGCVKAPHHPQVADTPSWWGRRTWALRNKDTGEWLCYVIFPSHDTRKISLRNFKPCVSNLNGFLFCLFPPPLRQLNCCYSCTTASCVAVSQGSSTAVEKSVHATTGAFSTFVAVTVYSFFVFAGHTVWCRNPPAHHYRRVHRLHSVCQRLPCYRLPQNGFQDNTLWTKERLALSSESSVLRWFVKQWLWTSRSSTYAYLFNCDHYVQLFLNWNTHIISR